ncbi:aldehyde dehydrogenase family protein [Pseudomonas sp. CC120222-01a]|uniref:aldehyde dehydrogenase family protein n=1 Tax=Pseudomonas sp. CC120222-01a TaxID=1378075 RepID=UPI000D936DF1|nr:aldehyde dehydrogenase family protein [Pseudomonas sp. CC120222-01a]PVZ41212.1 betaine-aldehyde dehydrogenase [Pseudomonas sp. CC120222-01a]
MRTKLYIDGQWRDAANGKQADVVDPATEEVVHQFASASPEDVDLAVKAARRAFDQDGWSRTTGKQRAQYLRRIAKIIGERQQELAALETLDNGKPLPEAMWDVGDSAGCFEYYAKLAEELDNDEHAIAVSDDRFACRIRREPLGVVGAITPWNYPLLMASWKVAPALAAGCTVVLKPAELTSLTALELAAIAEQAELPAGVLNVLTGSGSVAGDALVKHKQVDKVAFTGSGPIGSQIMREAATDMKRVTLELGGKSPMVVFEDADIEATVEWMMFGIFWNQGQVCSATSRVLIHESVYDKVLERLVDEAGKIKIGNGKDEGTLLGPLVSKKQLDQVSAAVERARSEGATVVCGGRRAPGFDKGYYYEPTVLADLKLDSDAWVEEIFGPVLCVRSFKTEAEAIEVANESRFGLAAAVMTQDQARAERVSNALRAGIVWVNCSQPGFTEAPWGGYKQSGIGRELGPWGLDNYLETKQVTSYVTPAPWGWYIK